MSDLLDEREKTHGAFMAVASKAQQIKDAMQGGKNWEELDDMQREALQMIASKIARILAGDYNEIDHWRDISGYSELVVRDLARINAYIAGEYNPTPHPGAHNPETPSRPPPASVWPMSPEEEEREVAARRG